MINGIDGVGAAIQTMTGNQDSGRTQSAQKNLLNADTFMTLLVAQLKYQDPLAPQDGAQFVAQLAQLNSLDQLVNINRRLDQLIERQQP